MKKILIAGGDMRQIYCAGQLSSEYDVYAVGIDKEKFPEGIDFPIADMNTAGEFDCAVLPIPLPDESGMLRTPLYSGTLTVSDIDKLVKQDGVVFTGMSGERLNEFFPGKKIFAYMEQEELTLRNAFITAEGAVMIALENMSVTLNGQTVLIAGLGRIGTSLAAILKGFGADVTALVRNEKGSAKAELAGIKSIYAEELDGGFGLVFNTVPSLVFTADVLEKFPEDTLFIELASSSGGFCEAPPRNIIQAQGLPGKTAPKSAGKALAETIRKEIERII